MLQNERGSARTHPVENSLWKRLWTCSKTEHRMNDELHLQASIFNAFFVNIRIFFLSFMLLVRALDWKCGRMGGRCFQY